MPVGHSPVEEIVEVFGGHKAGLIWTLQRHGHESIE